MFNTNILLLKINPNVKKIDSNIHYIIRDLELTILYNIKSSQNFQQKKEQFFFDSNVIESGSLLVWNDQMSDQSKHENW